MNEIKKTIEKWKQLDHSDLMSIEQIKWKLSGKDKSWDDLYDEMGNKITSTAKTQIIKFLLAKTEIQENKIMELEGKIKSLEERVSLNYKMLLEEKEE